MIPFKCRRDRTRTPIVRNEVIWDYAESLVGDYKPTLLREPAPLNSLHFLEGYLGVSVEFQDIYCERDQDPIAGATVFNDSRIRVFDREGQCVRVIDVAAGTVIIDNEAARIGKSFELFTELHEGGHFTMHGPVYTRNPDQISLFEAPDKVTAMVCCRKSSISRRRRRGRELTPEQNREHQANTFAAFAAMPRQTFVPMAKELNRNAGFSNGIFVEDEKDWESGYALDKVCDTLTEAYGTSRTAVEIHLRELGLLMNTWQYEDLKSQMAI